MIKENNLKRNFVWNIIGSTFSAFNSLFFMIAVTRINGEKTAGLFTFAFSTACLFYIIGIYSGRTYQVTDSNINNTDSDYLCSKFITCIIMIIVSIIFCFIRNYELYKIIVIISLTLFKSLEAFSEGIYAILQKNDNLYKVGVSLFIKAISSLILFIVIDAFTKNIFFSIISLIIVNLAVILLYDKRNLYNVKFKLKDIDKSAIKSILISGFYTFSFTILTQYVINAPRYAIDNFFDDKYQTIFGIIIMPSTLIALLVQFIIQPFLNKMKESLNVGKKQFLNFTVKLSLVLLLMGLFSCLVAYIIGIPFLEAIYNVELESYLKELIMIVFGATLYGITVILSSALIIMRKTLSQLIIFLIVTIFDLIFANILVNKYLILGAASTYLLTMSLLLILYVIIYIFGLKKYRRV